jgi:hypothetical protein
MALKSNNLIENKSRTSQLTLFTAKVAIVLLLFLGFGSVAVVITGNLFIHYTARIINKIEGTSPENVENYKLKVRHIGQKYQPILKEIILAWNSAKKKEAINPEQPDEKSLE